jgi:hypothetical protein
MVIATKRAGGYQRKISSDNGSVSECKDRPGGAPYSNIGSGTRRLMEGDQGLENIAPRRHARICVGIGHLPQMQERVPHVPAKCCSTVIDATALKPAECLSDPGLGRDRERMSIYGLIFCCRSSSVSLSADYQLCIHSECVLMRQTCV